VLWNDLVTLSIYDIPKLYDDQTLVFLDDGQELPSDLGQMVIRELALAYLEENDVQRRRDFAAALKVEREARRALKAANGEPLSDEEDDEEKAAARRRDKRRRHGSSSSSSSNSPARRDHRHRHSRSRSPHSHRHHRHRHSSRSPSRSRSPSKKAQKKKKHKKERTVSRGTNDSGGGSSRSLSPSSRAATEGPDAAPPSSTTNDVTVNTEAPSAEAIAASN